MAWNFMQVTIHAADRLIRPMIGPGELSREQAHAEIQSILDRLPEMKPIADAWRQGAKDDTVFRVPFTWTIYEHPAGEDPRRAALVWLEDYAQTIRATGIPVQVAAMPPPAGK